MSGQKINPKYLNKLKDFFLQHSLEDFQVIYDNEDRFKEYLDVNTFKFTNSGTSALYLILDFLYKNNSDRLIWGPAFTHISWVNVAEWIGYEYDFVDVDELTLSLSPSKLLEKLQTVNDYDTPDIVIMIDMGGYVGEDTLKVKEICKERNILLIEDAAHAFNQCYKEHKAGTIGDFGFYSFSNPKLLTCGEGGAIVSKDVNMNAAFEEAIYQGGWYRYNKQRRSNGLNFIMSNMNTELLRYQLEDIDLIMRQHKEKYLKFLKETNAQAFYFASDNQYYAPSFFATRHPKIIKTIVDTIDTLIYNRYTNLGGHNFTIAQKLQDTLLYRKF